ncbi:MAG: division/cell wall cluster transcriptional repressor MraZ [Sphingomonadales bacterium]|nr:division/cell wall cluster transcriptional repressor MraZ [Sphingomonadales bacterium]
MASQPYSYNGTGFSLLRDKGRFVLPPQFRKTVRDSSGDKAVLCLDKHDRWTCLIGFGLSRQDGFESQLDREETLAAQRGQDFDRELRGVQLNGFAQMPFDDSGRFVLPDYLAELAHVEDQLYFHGAGQFFVIWSPAELAKMSQGWEGAQAACRQLAAEAAGKAKAKGNGA